MPLLLLLLLRWLLLRGKGRVFFVRVDDDHLGRWTAYRRRFPYRRIDLDDLR